MEGDHDGRRVHITLGSPRFRRGLFRTALTHFMVLAIEAPTWLPDEAVVRPARRTVWDWREGSPGEKPNLVTQAGAGYVLFPESLVAEYEDRVSDAVRRLPYAGWVEATATSLHVRVRDLETGEAPEDVAEAVLSWDGFRTGLPGEANADG